MKAADTPGQGSLRRLADGSAVALGETGREGQRERALALLVGAVAIGVYLNALGGQWVSDAVQAIPNNHALVHSTGWLLWFTRDYYWGSPIQDVTLYRPLTVLSFLVHLRTTGLIPFPFLLGNVLLHAAVSVLVLRLGSRLLGLHAALMGALLFAVHPLHTEAVAWVMGRAELLAALFAMAACLAALRATDPAEPNPVRFVLGTVAAYLAALFSKEHVALLPLWFGLLWGLERRRRAAIPAAWIGIGSALVLAGFLLLRANSLTRQASGDLAVDLYNPAAVVPAPLRWVTAAAVLARYLGLFLWPAHLSIDYSYAQVPASTGVGPMELAGITVILGALGGFTVAARWAPGVALALALAPITFALVSNFPFPIGPIMAERLTYLPSVGLCLVAGWVVTRGPLPAFASWRGQEGAALRGEPWKGWVVVGFVAFIVLSLSVRTLVRNGDWESNDTVYRAALRVSPRSALVQGGVARQELRNGNAVRAMELAQEAARLYPRRFTVLLGDVYLHRKDFDRAVEHYRKAMLLAPRDTTTRVRLGTALRESGRLEEAERELGEAVRLSPGLLPARFALGELLLDARRAREALQQFEAAERSNPGNPSVLYGMARAALELGDRRGAAAHARRAAAAGLQVPEAFWRALGSSS